MDGILQTSWADTVDVDAPSSNFYIGHDPFNDPAQDFEGYLSNFRVIKGTALYTTNFRPPSVELTNVTNTKLLCCQSDSSTTAATVTPNTITANGNVSAGASTLTLSPSLGIGITWPSSIKWDGGSAPTLASSPVEENVITLLTRDEGVTWYGWESMSNSTTTYQWWTWGNNHTGTVSYTHLRAHET